MSDEDAERIIQYSAEIARENAARYAAGNPMQGVQLRQPTPEQLYENERLSKARDEILLRQKQWSLWTYSGIPTRYKNASITDLASVPGECAQDYATALDRLKLVIDQPAVVALIGKRGTGKTHMSCAVAREFCRKCQTVHYLDALDYLIQLKETYNGNAKRDEAMVERTYLKPALLIIDEMHERGETEWEDRMLTRLVNKRYAAKVATILISNQTAKEFSERIGASILDRIRDEGGMITCEWGSLRGKIQ